MEEIVTVSRPFERVRALQSRLKLLVLLLGDTLLYYISLVLVLFVRYGSVDVRSEFFVIHLTPFTIGLLILITTFYVGGLYDRPSLKNSRYFARRFLFMVGLSGLFLSMLFYFVPAFGIAPKANLFLFVVFFSVIGYAWRFAFNAVRNARSGARANKVVLIGTSQTATDIAQYLSLNQQLGYEVTAELSGESSAVLQAELSQLVQKNLVNTVIVPRHIAIDTGFAHILYSSLLRGIEIVGLTDFYEIIFEKVALVELDEVWFFENLKESGSPYYALKRTVEVGIVLIGGVILLPLMIVLALLIKLTSQGPVLYRQQRVGKNGKTFTLYKFRSMYNSIERNPDAEATKPIWTTDKDERVTPVGRFIRMTHMDEYPQLYNILRGHMSLIGPRPGRPELDVTLKAEIPYYELRYLVRPGLSGYAQINYGYGASIEDERKKLQYDIYYLKHRSFWFDMSILFKTLNKIFS